MKMAYKNNQSDGTHESSSYSFGTRGTGGHSILLLLYLEWFFYSIAAKRRVMTKIAHTQMNTEAEKYQLGRGSGKKLRKRKSDLTITEKMCF